MDESSLFLLLCGFLPKEAKNLKKPNIASEVEALLTPVIEGLGYAVWDVQFRKVGADFTLTVTIDSDEGISIDDCEKVHRTIDPLLDEADPIDVAYVLEVSSPGIEREIRTDAHIAACMGEEIEARESGDGWCAVCYEGVPMGAGKVSAGRIKNHYPKGLRNKN